jgi:rubrerythrin
MGNATDSYYADEFKRGMCQGMIAALRQALKDEHDAVNSYQAILDAGLDGSHGLPLFGKMRDTAVKTLEHIRDEEIDHEEELVQLINSLQRMCVPGMGKHKTKVK